MQNKQKIYIGIVVLALIIIVTFLLSSNLLHRSLFKTGGDITPTLNPNAQTNPPVAYNQQGAKSILNKIEKKQYLSPTDSTIKNRLIAATNSEGVVYKTNDFRVDYVKAADEFQVEILTTDTANAKKLANEWLRSKGLSQQGICNLPILFYLNFDIANQLRGKGIEFNPTPDGC